jgi:hypothetical protein
MRYTWANTILLVLLLLQIITGFWGLISGSEGFSWVLWFHGVGGYAVAVILFWKGAVIFNAFRRRRWLTLSGVSFIVLAIFLLIILATGIVWTHVGPIDIGSYSLMTIHGNLTILLAALLLWHVLARQFVFRLPKARDRRAFLRLAGTTLAGLVVWNLTDRVKAAANLPGAKRRFTGSYETGSLSGRFPIVSWLFDFPRPLELDRYRLSVEGAVEQPLSLSYADLTHLAEATVTTPLDCTGGWYSTQVWRGVNLGQLLDKAGVKESARSVTVEAASGYKRRFPLAQARGYLLALQVAGEPLIHGHGFPLRLVAPGQRGFAWVKWVVRLRVNETSHLWQPPLPLQ